MYQIFFYVPISDAERVKAAVFAAGAGRIGNYDMCCWQTEGTGQFRGNDQSNPTLGTQGEVEFVKELRIEFVCNDQKIDQVLAALKESHPYETPAFGVLALDSRTEQ